MSRGEGTILTEVMNTEGERVLQWVMTKVWGAEDGVFRLVETCNIYKNGDVIVIKFIEARKRRILVSMFHSYYLLEYIKRECLEVEQEIVWTVKKKKRDTYYPSKMLL